jgi:hypothetical protein
MTLRLTHVHVAAVAMAVATVSLAWTPARAFTVETVSPSANGANFADPDDQVKNFGHGYQFGSGGPVVQFGAQPQQPFGLGRFGPGAGFAPTPTPPDPYSRPPGNGD